MLKILIINSCILPVPAVSGGAVEYLEESIVKYNEIYKRAELTIISLDNPEAVSVSNNYKNTKFIFFAINKGVKFLDAIIFKVANKVLSNALSLRFRFLLQRLMIIKKTKKVLMENNYDRIVIENSSLMFNALKSQNIIEKYSGKCVFHVHNELKSAYGCSDIIRKSLILCVSGYIKDSLPDYTKPAPEKLRKVLRNGIDLSKFRNTYDVEIQGEIKKKYGLNTDDIVVLFCGQLKKEKGIEELLTAFSNMDNEHVKLIVAGGYFFDSKISNKFENKLKKIAEKKADKIIFTGYIPYDSLPELYAVADIACVPSVWDDPAPLTVLEALAAGCPLITTKSGGIPEYANSECAIILERNESIIDNLTKAMMSLCNDVDARLRMRDAAIKTATELNLNLYCKNFFDYILDDVGKV